MESENSKKEDVKLLIIPEVMQEVVSKYIKDRPNIQNEIIVEYFIALGQFENADAIRATIAERQAAEEAKKAAEEEEKKLSAEEILNQAFDAKYKKSAENKLDIKGYDSEDYGGCENSDEEEAKKTAEYTDRYMKDVHSTRNVEKKEETKPVKDRLESLGDYLKEKKKPALFGDSVKGCGCGNCSADLTGEKLLPPLQNTFDIKKEMAFLSSKLENFEEIDTYLLAVVLDDYVMSHPDICPADIKPSVIADIMEEYMTRVKYYKYRDVEIEEHCPCEHCNFEEEAIITDDIGMI